MCATFRPHLDELSELIVGVVVKPSEISATVPANVDKIVADLFASLGIYVNGFDTSKLTAEQAIAFGQLYKATTGCAASTANLLKLVISSSWTTSSSALAAIEESISEVGATLNPLNLAINILAKSLLNNTTTVSIDVADLLSAITCIQGAVIQAVYNTFSFLSVLIKRNANISSPLCESLKAAVYSSLHSLINALAQVTEPTDQTAGALCGILTFSINSVSLVFGSSFSSVSNVGTTTAATVTNILVEIKSSGTYDAITVLMTAIDDISKVTVPLLTATSTNAAAQIINDIKTALNIGFASFVSACGTITGPVNSSGVLLTAAVAVSVEVTNVQSKLSTLLTAIGSSTDLNPAEIQTIFNAELIAANAIQTLFAALCKLSSVAASHLSAAATTLVVALSVVVSVVVHFAYIIISGLSTLLFNLLGRPCHLIYKISSSILAASTNLATCVKGVSGILSGETFDFNFIKEFSSSISNIASDLINIVIDLPNIETVGLENSGAVVWPLSTIIGELTGGKCDLVASAVSQVVNNIYPITVTLANPNSQTAFEICQRLKQEYMKSFEILENVVDASILAITDGSLIIVTDGFRKAFGNVRFSIFALVDILMSYEGNFVPACVPAIELALRKVYDNAIQSLINATSNVCKAVQSIVTTAVNTILIVSLLLIVGSVLNIISYLIYGLIDFIMILTGAPSQILTLMGTSISGTINGIAALLTGSAGFISETVTIPTDLFLQISIRLRSIDLLPPSIDVGGVEQTVITAVAATVRWPLDKVVSVLLSGPCSIVASNIGQIVTKLHTVTDYLLTPTLPTAQTLLLGALTTTTASFKSLCYDIMPIVFGNGIDTSLVHFQIDFLKAICDVEVALRTVIDGVTNNCAAWTSKSVAFFNQAVLAVGTAFKFLITILSQLITAAIAVASAAATILIYSVILIVGTVFQLAYSVLAGLFGLIKFLFNTTSAVVTALLSTLKGSLDNIAGFLPPLNILNMPLPTIKQFLSDLNSVVGLIASACDASLTVSGQGVKDVVVAGAEWTLSGILSSFSNGPFDYLNQFCSPAVETVGKITISLRITESNVAVSTLQSLISALSSSGDLMNKALDKIFSSFPATFTDAIAKVLSSWKNVQSSLTALILAVISACGSWTTSSISVIEAAVGVVVNSIAGLIGAVYGIAKLAVGVVGSAIGNAVVLLGIVIGSVLQIASYIVSGLYGLITGLAGIVIQVLYGLGSIILTTLANFAKITLAVSSSIAGPLVEIGSYLIQCVSGYSTILAKLNDETSSLIESITVAEITSVFNVVSTQLVNTPMKTICSTVLAAGVSINYNIFLYVNVQTVGPALITTKTNCLAAFDSLNAGFLEVLGAETGELKPILPDVKTSVYNVRDFIEQLWDTVISSSTSLNAPSVVNIEKIVCSTATALRIVLSALTTVAQAAVSIGKLIVGRIVASLSLLIGGVVELVYNIVRGIYALIKTLAGIASKVLSDSTKLLYTVLNNVISCMTGADSIFTGGSNANSNYLGQVIRYLGQILPEFGYTANWIKNGIGIEYGNLVNWGLSGVISTIVDGPITYVSSTVGAAISLVYKAIVPLSSCNANTVVTILQGLANAIKTAFGYLYNILVSFVANLSGALITLVGGFTTELQNVENDFKAIISNVSSGSTIGDIEKLACNLANSIKALFTVFSTITQIGTTIISVVVAQLLTVLSFVLGGIVQLGIYVFSAVKALFNVLYGVASKVLAGLKHTLVGTLDNFSNCLIQVVDILAPGTTDDEINIFLARVDSVSSGIVTTLQVTVNDVDVAAGSSVWSLGGIVSELIKTPFGKLASSIAIIINGSASVFEAFSSITNINVLSVLWNAHSFITTACASINNNILLLQVDIQLSSLVSSVTLAIQNVQNSIYALLKLFISGCGSWSATVIAAIETAVCTLAKDILALTKAVAGLAAGAIVIATTAVVQLVKSIVIVFGCVLNITKQLASGLYGTLKLLARLGVKVFPDLVSILSGTIAKLTGCLKTVMNAEPYAILTQINNGLNLIVSEQSTILITLPQGVGLVVGNVPWVLTGFLQGLFGSSISVYAATSNSIVSIVYQSISGLKNVSYGTLPIELQTLNGAVNQAFGLIQNICGDTILTQSTTLVPFVNAIATAVTDVKTNILAFIGVLSGVVLTAKILEALEAAAVKLGTFIKALTTAVVNFAQAAAKEVTDPVANIVSIVTVILASILQITHFIVYGVIVIIRVLAGFTSHILSSLGSTLMESLKGVKVCLSSLPAVYNGATGAIRLMLAAAGPALVSVVNGIGAGVDLLTQGVGAVAKAVLGSVSNIFSKLLGRSWSESGVKTVTDICAKVSTDVAKSANAVAGATPATVSPLLKALSIQLTISLKLVVDICGKTATSADPSLITIAKTCPEFINVVQQMFDELIQSIMRSTSTLNPLTIKMIEATTVRLACGVQSLGVSIANVISVAVTLIITVAVGSLAATLVFVLGTILKTVIDVLQSIYTLLITLSGTPSIVLKKLIDVLNVALSYINGTLGSAVGILNGETIGLGAIVLAMKTSIDNLSIVLSANVDGIVQLSAGPLIGQMNKLLSTITTTGVALVTPVINAASIEVINLATPLNTATLPNGVTILSYMGITSISLTKCINKVLQSFDLSPIVKTAITGCTTALNTIGINIDTLLKSITATCAAKFITSTITAMETAAVKLANSIVDLITIISNISKAATLPLAVFVSTITILLSYIVYVLYSMLFSCNMFFTNVNGGIANKVLSGIASALSVSLDGFIGVVGGVSLAIRSSTGLAGYSTELVQKIDFVKITLSAAVTNVTPKSILAGIITVITPTKWFQ